MSRTTGPGQGKRRDRGQRAQGEPGGGQPQTGQEAEVEEWSRETGYRPSINQQRDEPLPASPHDQRHQEAVVNEDHASDDVPTGSSRRSRRSNRG